LVLPDECLDIMLKTGDFFLPFLSGVTITMLSLHLSTVLSFIMNIVKGNGMCHIHTRSLFDQLEETVGFMGQKCLFSQMHILWLYIKESRGKYIFGKTI